jgi:hypothetical protein
MVTIMLVHHDGHLDGGRNERRVFSVLCEKLPICSQSTDESRARSIALRAYDTARVPKKLIERNQDTGKEIVLASDPTSQLTQA